MPATVTVRDCTGTRRPRPASGGIPLPEGAAPAGATFRLADAEGRDVPLQAEVLAPWKDGSARWVLLDFVADPGADSTATYQLHWGPPGERAAPSAARADATSGDTDPGRSLQSTGAPPAAEAPTPSPPGALVTLAGRLAVDLRLTLGDGTVCAAQAHTTRFLTTGPVRVTQEIRGDFTRPGKGPGGARVFQFRLWATVYPGQPFIKLEPLVLIDADEGLMQHFRALEFVLRPLQGLCSATLGGDPGWEGEPGEGARLWQVDDRNYRLLGAAVGHGDKAPGWLSLDDGDGPVALALRDFWRQWPKSLDLRSDEVALGLFPAFEAGAYAHMEPWYKHQYLFDGDCYRLRAGQAKRWEVWLDLTGDGPALAAHADAPLVAAANPTEAIATGVWDDIAPAGAPGMAEYDTWAANLFEAYCHSIDVQRDFGEMNWGDWFGERKVNWGNHEYDTANQIFIQFARTGDPRYLHWGSAAARHCVEVDTVHHVNGALAEYYAPWTTSAYPPRPGMVHQHAVGHVGGYYTVEQVEALFEQVGLNSYLCLDPYNLGHIFTQGMARHYFLTGDPFVRETAEIIGDNLARLVEDRQYQFMGTTHCGRVTGWTLLALAGAYELAFDDRYVRAMKTLVGDALADQDPHCGGWLINPMSPDHCECTTGSHTGMAGFITAVLINGLSRYYLLSGDESLPDAVARAVTFLDNDTWREEWRDWRYTSCPASPATSQPGVVIMAHTNAVRIAGCDEHLRVLRTAWDAKFQRLLSVPKPGPGQGKAFSSIMYGCPEAIGLLANRAESTRDD